MSKQPAKQPSQRPAPRRRGGPGQVVAVMMLCGAALLAVFSLPMFMIVAAGMVPTCTAYFVDREPEKYAPIAVGAFNGVGVLPYILELLTGISTVNAALEILINPFTWLVMYGGAGIGWVVYLGMPTFAAVWLEASNDAHVARLRKEQAKLLEEWGADLDPGALPTE